MSATKELKEAFVTGHTGTTPIEILCVCASAPIGIFVYQQVVHYYYYYFAIVDSNKRNSKSYHLVTIELLCVLLPMTICQTKFFYPVGITILLLELILGVTLLYFNSTTFFLSQKKQQQQHQPSCLPKKNLDFLTAYRSSVLLLTFIAILAVDFHVFPRRFAKTENRGYGLMDLGAGSIVVSAGFASTYARGSSEPKFIMNGIKKTLPLLIMGCIRLFANKGIQYQEHVSEYGVHWNFFFTLTIVNVLSSCFRKLMPTKRGTVLVPITILGLYQWSLLHWGVQTYMESAPRQQQGDDGLAYLLFAANREGILGSVSYLSLYLISEDIARCCLWNVSSSSLRMREHKQQQQQNNVQGMRLLAVCSSLWVVHWMLTQVIGIPVSRRSTNATFLVWTLAHNVSILFLNWVAFSLCCCCNLTKSNKHDYLPIIVEAINRHGLLLFILANLLTGAVNLTLNTLDASDGMALLVIICYICTVGTIALYLDLKLSNKSNQ